MKKLTMLFVILLFCASQSFAEVGVTADKIVLGQSCALEGPASSLGQGMATGLNVYFDYINSKGGVNGRKIELISKNDGYEPMQAIQTTLDLIRNDNVFLLIGEVGTPTSKALMPVIEKEQIPFVAPFTGAELLRTPFKHWVINVRGSYNQEMEKLAEYLVDAMGYTNIACFYQNDAYGKAGLSGIEIALEKRNMKLSGTGTYERNTIAIQEGLASIKATNAEAIVMVGAYTPCAAFIRSAKSTPELANAKFCNISFVGTKALKEALGDEAEGCIVSQVVPYPWDTNNPMVKEYNTLMTNAGLKDQIGFITLEGFMAAKFICDAFSKIEGELTREKFIQCVESVGTFDLGGTTLTYGANDHQGMDDVFIVEFTGQEIKLAKY